MSNAMYVQSVLDDHFKAISDQLKQPDVANQIANIVQQLTLPPVRVISVIGGAASGKTTIAEEMVKALEAVDITAEMLSTDDYVVGDRTYRQQELKNADAQKKYDFQLMDDHIRAIKALESVQTVAVPEIDTESGVAVDAGQDSFKRQIGKLDVLIIEGDFPRDDYDVRFFIQVPDQQRLENNLERDDDVDAGKLIEQFNDRQRTLHKPYTLPALQSADYVLLAQVDHKDWLYTMYQRDN